MGALSTPTVCARARAQISQQLDAEPSQLERAMVAAHVQRCAACRSYERELQAVTGELRSAPLEPLTNPIVVRRPRRATISRTPVVAAAAVVVAVLGVVGSALELRQDSPGGPTAAEWDSARSLAHEVELILDAPPPGEPGPQGTLHAI